MSENDSNEETAAATPMDIRTHELKTHPGPFEEVWHGWKTAELRHDDREFRLGDYLMLSEWDPETEAYTGRTVRCRVTCVTRGWGLPSDMCMLSLGPRTGYESGNVAFEEKRGGWLPYEWPDLREPRGASS